MPLKTIDWNALGEPEIGQWLAQLEASNRTGPFPEGYDFHKLTLGRLGRSLCPWEAFDQYYNSGAMLLALVKRDAAALIIPFLIEMLRYDSTRNKAHILGILDNLATFSTLEHFLIEDRMPAADIEDYRFCAARLFNAVYAGIDTYTYLLEDEDRFVRDGAANLLDVLNGTTESDSG